MKEWTVYAALLFSLIFLQSCGAQEPSLKKFYVLIEESPTEFPQQLAKIAEKIGLSVEVGSATDDRGRTQWVVNAKGRWIEVWAMNMPLSGNEDPLHCGQDADPGPDPGQFIVTVEPLFFPLGAWNASEIAGSLYDGVSELGYRILEKPIACSGLAKRWNEKSE